MKWKQRLKQNKLFYLALHKARNFRQNFHIGREQAAFERTAQRTGIVIGENTERVFEQLRSCLAVRGIKWPPATGGRPLHILYASLPGNWERHNIPPALEKIGKTSYFFLEEQGIELAKGWAATRSQVDQLLPHFVRKVHAQAPIDMMISYLSGSQISPQTIEEIKCLGIATFSFHLDDRMFFYGYKYGSQWSGPAAVCQAYDLNLTNAPTSLVKYRCSGANALFWPEGANPDFFRPQNIPFEHDVTFCGQRYGQRPLLIDYLRRQGIKVACFGKEWEHGYQTNESLVKIFNASRINLGFGFVTESDDQCLKGRDFEIPACGAVYLTSHNEDLARVYRIGTEIETYRDFADCAAKIKALMADPTRCERMRRAARQAVLARHSWSLRIRQLIDCSGVPLIARE